MTFWGVEVKPGKPYSLHLDDSQGKIHITQATLGVGSATEKSILQCNVGKNSPVFLCTLIPDKTECIQLYLEFEDDGEVTFSVLGPRSVHLSGFSSAYEDNFDGNDDSFGEDISETGTEESSDYDSEDEYDDEFIDDGTLGLFPPSPARNSGVVIEEIMDDDKPTKRNKRSKRSDNQDKSDLQKQIVVKNDAAVQELDSEDEDEDGFPVSVPNKSNLEVEMDEAEKNEVTKDTTAKAKKKKKKTMKTKDIGDSIKSSKRKNDTLTQDAEGERNNKKKTKQQVTDEEALDCGNKKDAFKENDHTVTNKRECNEDSSHVVVEACSDHVEAVTQSDEKKKKKKSKKLRAAKKEQSDSSGVVNQSSDKMEKRTENQPSQVRTFGNGMVVEELAMGKPNGKKACPGNKVSVHYIGKLKNGKIFDSNIGRAPFKFRLGIGQVIKGWDVGVKGMRVGDKRRLTIPPSMGYGATRAGQIPPNSWLHFDVELADVQ